MGKHYIESIHKVVRIVTEWMLTCMDRIVKQVD